MHIFNTSKFARARWLYDVIVTSFEVQWFSFWYQWIEEVHIYTNIGVSSVLYRKIQRGGTGLQQPPPPSQDVLQKYLRRTIVKIWLATGLHTQCDLSSFQDFFFNFLSNKVSFPRTIRWLSVKNFKEAYTHIKGKLWKIKRK